MLYNVCLLLTKVKLLLILTLFNTVYCKRADNIFIKYTRFICNDKEVIINNVYNETGYTISRKYDKKILNCNNNNYKYKLIINNNNQDFMKYYPDLISIPRHDSRGY